MEMGQQFLSVFKIILSWKQQQICSGGLFPYNELVEDVVVSFRDTLSLCATSSSERACCRLNANNTHLNDDPGLLQHVAHHRHPYHAGGAVLVVNPEL